MEFMEFDISQSPMFPVPGVASIQTSCGLHGVSPTTGATVPTRCGQVVQALVSAAGPLYNPPGHPQVDFIDSGQGGYGDGLWSRLQTADPARTNGMVPVWVRAALEFSNNVQVHEVGGGCSNPKFGKDQVLVDIIRDGFWDPSMTVPCGWYPQWCITRLVEEDLWAYRATTESFNAGPLGLDYRSFTARFLALPGAPFAYGSLSCRLLDLP